MICKIVKILMLILLIIVIKCVFDCVLMWKEYDFMLLFELLIDEIVVVFYKVFEVCNVFYDVDDCFLVIVCFYEFWRFLFVDIFLGFCE